MYTKSDILKQDYYKISKAAEFMGISSQTLRKRIDMGLVPCLRSENKYRLIPAEAIVEYLYSKNMLLPEPEILKHDVIYARVSTRKQEKRGDLERQITNIKLFAIEQNVKNLIVTSDVASGLNDNRKGLNSILNLIMDGKVDRLFIMYKDRLTRFGFNYIKRIIHMLEYKCRVNGIHFIVREESHTSKCSFIDQESIDITKTTLEDVLNEVSLSPCLVRNTIRMLTVV